MMLYSPISSEKLKLFVELYNTALKEFTKDGKMHTWSYREDSGLHTPEGAALMVVANALLNLDEVVMKN